MASSHSRRPGWGLREPTRGEGKLEWEHEIGNRGWRVIVDVKRFFESRFAVYGDSSRTLDLSVDGQQTRFRVLSDVGDMSGRRVLELGSGLGHFYEYLRNRFGELEYTGFDLSEKFVTWSREKYPDARFEVHDVLNEALTGDFDFVLCSGMHNLETGANDSDMVRLIRRAWEVTRTGAAFSMLSTHADRREPDRHYYDPLAMSAGALKLTRFVVLRQEYMPHDFTLYLYRGLPRAEREPGRATGIGKP